MRVLDLLEMLNDISKNTLIFINFDNKKYAIKNIEIIDNKLYININTASKNSLKNWELSILINKKEFLKYTVFIKANKKNHQVFGLRLSDSKIILY